MLSLQKLEKSLKRLDLSWKVIETTARVVSPPGATGFIATLEHTRSAFSRLAAEMVEQIAQTHLANCRHDLAARAQVAIDILVRNLFERTADVGFIATDGPLVSFVMNPQPHDAPALHARLTEYRNKYTVYDDILVLDASARILLSLQNGSSHDTGLPPWWGQAMAHSGYVETFGPSGLFKTDAPVLLYAHRIVTPDGAVCGAVVLKFDLQSELLSIFKALQHQGIAIVLLDERARAVACSDASTLALGQRLDVPEGRTLRLSGVDYVFAHCKTRGYQGYGGPGWTALALRKLDDAFETATQPAVADAAQTGHDAGAGNIEIELDNAALHDIILRAKSIEQDLNRVIWNGKLQDSGLGSGSALGPVFAEIGRTSAQTISAFDGAIQELKHLLMAGRRAELASHAALAVDIMDRNLYERANDCRWWALSEEFAHILQSLESGPSDTAVRRAADILAHLNSLYTVYRRVALFDRQGRIIAVSRDSDTLAADTHIAATLLQNTLSLKGTQAYAVSDMLPHALADGEATYLYCTPIRGIAQDRVLGGIALAFNCSTELQAMLQDALPEGAAASGLLVDAAGKVLASTDARIGVGDSPAFLSGLKAPRTDAAMGLEADTRLPLCHWEGRTYLAGVALSKGYREFKVSDGYRNDVRSVLLVPVDAAAQAQQGFALPKGRLAAGAVSLQYGVVQCGRMMFALSSAHVVEAVATTHMGAPAADSNCAGLLRYAQDGQVAVLPVYDGCTLTGQAAIADTTNAVAIVLRGTQHTMALLVNRLVDVIECSGLEAPPGGSNPDAPWIGGYIHDNQAHTEPVFALDPCGFG
jgi:hypothetical protein